ncbi:MAG: LOG family protein [Acidobacteriota bacterium]|nr:LOG family protein [Acidobacteriota bacterium]
MSPRDDTAHGWVDETAVDLVEIIDGSVAQLWETIESLERLQPRNLERFRVSIFGSGRIAESDPLFTEAEDLGLRLAETGCDIVTGGGGGLMHAVDRGASRGKLSDPAEGDLPVRLVTDSDDSPFVERVYRHRTFFSRLHHFVRLSSAFIVLPGGIGSTLEAMMVWQLLQVKHLPPIPFLLFGDHWRGLLSWIENESLRRGYISRADADLPILVGTVDETVRLIEETKAVFDRNEPIQRATVQSPTNHDEQHEQP